MIFSLPIKTVCELNRHEHWRFRSRRAQMQKAAVSLALGRWLRAMAERPTYTITLTRIAPSRGLDPGDNLPSSMKFVRDAVADEIGLDDHSDRYTWIYQQRRGMPREYGVEIEVHDG